jgi:outer membrane beta-barrel protein
MSARGFRFTLLFVLLGAGWAHAQTAEQEAGNTSVIDREDRGPLKAKIPPVSGHFFLQKGRFELTPSVGLTIRDAFFSKYILSGSLTYHASESFGVMLRGGYSIVGVSSAVQKCLTGPGGVPVCSSPTMNDVDGIAPGNIQGLAELNLQWSPLYGKIALIAERVVHFNLYAIGGPAAVLYGGPRPAGASSGDTPTWTVGGNVGIGMHFFINRWSTLRVELLDLIYQENVGVGGVQTTSLRNQLMFDLGVSFYFPNNYEEG